MTCESHREIGHQLVDELAGFHAIRVNEQYRIIFRFEGEHAFDVRCTDYH